jgi:hypothetical protein
MWERRLGEILTHRLLIQLQDYLRWSYNAQGYNQVYSLLSTEAVDTEWRRLNLPHATGEGEPNAFPTSQIITRYAQHPFKNLIKLI